jgi:hypothetical protein
MERQNTPPDVEVFHFSDEEEPTLFGTKQRCLLLSSTRFILPSKPKIEEERSSSVEFEGTIMLSFISNMSLHVSLVNQQMLVCVSIYI